ncbi:MAG TPA: thiamine biosynthesis protein ThiS [Dehalococcoidia bacterium]|jgi:sulfur carrier protein|nr:thiamine biosynthesis protein ThiS [Chloroflexota bacterium]HCV28466.1 thiamine biosynthesis protein ThiS [Dehalococcoidia bacterium]|tara:strand:- start:730 stop:933 length:204 start_codon:yes stop_codon:yes gene_type:complete
MISVTINGSETELDGSMSLIAYLEFKDLAERKVAVAVNGVIVRRPEYDSIVIQDGDRLEIVRPAGGG